MKYTNSLLTLGFCCTGGFVFALANMLQALLENNIYIFAEANGVIIGITGTFVSYVLVEFVIKHIKAKKVGS